MGKLTFWALVRCSRLAKWWWHNIGGNMESKFLAVSNIFDGRASTGRRQPNDYFKHNRRFELVKETHPACGQCGTRIPNCRIASPTRCRLFGHAAYSWYYARTTTRVNRWMKGINRLLGGLECQFKCISANTIYYTICTLCEKVYNGATSRKLRDRFREHV